MGLIGLPVVWPIDWVMHYMYRKSAGTWYAYGTGTLAAASTCWIVRMREKLWSDQIAWREKVHAVDCMQ